MLYDLLACEHRLSLDVHGDPKKRDSVSPFVQLLWEKGSAFESDTIRGLRLPFVDLSSFSGSDKELRTIEAMQQQSPLIYSGRITHGDLIGEPDLLRWEGNGYAPGDIKSGAGEEGAEYDKKPKRNYAVQLALYVDILEQKGVSAGRQGFIWDVHGEEVIYLFDAPRGLRSYKTLWDEYLETLDTAKRILNRPGNTRPAYAADCKQCYWFTNCQKELTEYNDLTLIPELGRSKRNTLVSAFENIQEFARSDPADYIRGRKTVFAGIGPGTLIKLHHRAKMLSEPNSQPYVKKQVDLSPTTTELFFDIETDPMRDLCYLHGFVEVCGDAVRYVYFLAKEATADEEKTAFVDALNYWRANIDAKVYYYSRYERTFWRKLQTRYPDVCSAEEIESLFAPNMAIDLYNDIVRPHTEWPTHDFSIKTLAKYLGFQWRDKHPSGAASIEWYHRWTESGDQSIRQRILDYNEDDCLATKVLLDGLRRLKVNTD